MGQTQALIYDSAAEDYKPGFKVNGFVTSCILYGVFAFSSWLSPSIVVRLGPRISMIIAALTYVFNIVQLLYLNDISIYIATVIIGFGAPVIWTAQGTVLSHNSDPGTITRNSGVFWAMNSSSQFIGNLFAYFVFKDEEYITENRKNILAYGLTGVSAVGVILMFFLRPTPWIKKKQDVSLVETLKESWYLLLTPDMALFTLILFYTGIQQSVWAGVYSGAIGFSIEIGEDRKALASLSGVIIAVGEVLGGILFGFLGHVTVKKGRDPIIMLGFLLSSIAYFLMFVNLPFKSTLGETDEFGYWGPNRIVTLVTSFLLGFSDACFNTQVMAILGGYWKDKPASAFGLFKFFQSIATAIAFLYAAFIELQWQLLIAVAFGIIGTIACVKVEMKTQRVKSGDDIQEKEKTEGAEIKTEI